MSSVGSEFFFRKFTGALLTTTEIEIRIPLKLDFSQDFGKGSYCLKFSLKSKFMVLLFSKIPSKNFCLRRKIPTHFFRMRCYFTLYTGSKPCKTGPKIFACGAKWTTFQDPGYYFLKFPAKRFLLFEIFLQMFEKVVLPRGGFLFLSQWYMTGICCGVFQQN